MERLGINPDLLPIKAHYFFYMAAMGPILPQLAVFGRELGISPVIMGSITGLLPLAFLVAKPMFGLLVDVFRTYRKAIFIALIITMSGSYALFAFIPSRTIDSFDIQVDCLQVDRCNVTVSNVNFMMNGVCVLFFTPLESFLNSRKVFDLNYANFLSVLDFIQA